MLAQNFASTPRGRCLAGGTAPAASVVLRRSQDVGEPYNASGSDKNTRPRLRRGLVRSRNLRRSQVCRRRARRTRLHGHRPPPRRKAATRGRCITSISGRGPPPATDMLSCGTDGPIRREVEVAGLHPATDSVIPYIIGHVLPVLAETGASYGDLDEEYLTASYRVYMTEAAGQGGVRLYQAPAGDLAGVERRHLELRRVHPGHREPHGPANAAATTCCTLRIGSISCASSMAGGATCRAARSRWHRPLPLRRRSARRRPKSLRRCRFRRSWTRLRARDARARPGDYGWARKRDSGGLGPPLIVLGHDIGTRRIDLARVLAFFPRRYVTVAPSDAHLPLVGWEGARSV